MAKTTEKTERTLERLRKDATHYCPACVNKTWDKSLLKLQEELMERNPDLDVRSVYPSFEDSEIQGTLLDSEGTVYSFAVSNITFEVSAKELTLAQKLERQAR